MVATSSAVGVAAVVASLSTVVVVASAVAGNPSDELLKLAASDQLLKREKIPTKTVKTLKSYTKWRGAVNQWQLDRYTKIVSTPGKF